MVTREKHNILWKGVDYFMRNSIKKGYGVAIGVCLAAATVDLIRGLILSVHKTKKSEANEEPNEGLNNESTENKEEA